jgi:hypothetical protein
MGVNRQLLLKDSTQSKLDTRNNCDFGRVMIRSVFDEVSVGS